MVADAGRMESIEELNDRIKRLEEMLGSGARQPKRARRRAGSTGGGMSRAGLLKGLVVGAAGAAIAGAGALAERPRSVKAAANTNIEEDNLFAANGNDPDLQFQAAFSNFVDSGNTTYDCGATLFGTKQGVYAEIDPGDGTDSYAAPTSLGPYGIYGEGRELGVGVAGNSTAYDGVHGTTSGNGRTGVWGNDTSSAGGYGLAGYSSNGIGVYASVSNNDAIQGHSSKAGKSGVAGFGDASQGFGTFGQGLYGVWGRTIGGRAGVVGTTDTSGGGGPTSGSYGVYGNGSSNGVGMYGTSSGTDAIQGVTTANSHSGVFGQDNSASGGFGMYGTSNLGIGAFGITSGNGQSGVVGRDQSANGGYGVQGVSVKGTGVYGTSASTAPNAAAVRAELTSTSPGLGSAALLAKNDATNGNGFAVLASSGGTTVSATSSGGDAVVAMTTSSEGRGVYAQAASGTAVVATGGVGLTAMGTNGDGAQGSTGTATCSGVVGAYTGTDATGAGVKGTHAGAGSAGSFNSAKGTGVVGSSVAGRGAKFSGKLAQLSLKPGATAGQPTTGAHVAGDIFVDKNCNMYLCVVDGTPGTWKQFVLQSS
jgi:hypothetical protein